MIKSYILVTKIPFYAQEIYFSLLMFLQNESYDRYECCLPSESKITVNKNKEVVENLFTERILIFVFTGTKSRDWSL